MLNLKKNIVGILFTIGCFVTSCSNSTDDILSSQDSIMLINASPNATGISIKFNDETLNTNPILYTQNTNYGLINSGIKQVITTQPPSNVQLLSLPMLLKNSKVYSVFFAGQINSSQLIYVATQDDLNPPERGKSKYRFINVAQNSKTLDLRLIGTNKDSVLAANIPYGSASNFTEIKPGKYNFKLVSRDKTIKDSVTLNYTLTNGKIYTFWAKGLVNGEGDKALGIQTIINK